MEKYKECIFDLTGYFYFDLIKFLKEENRFHGIVRSYFSKISREVSKADKKTDEDLIEIMSKSLYDFRGYIYSDFKRLRQKRLTPADSLITMLRKYFSFIDSDPDFIYQEEFITIKDIIEKLYLNIRNQSKKDPFYNTTSFLSKTEESVGYKGSCYQLSFYNIEFPKPKKLVLKGTEILIDKSNTNNEIDL